MRVLEFERRIRGLTQSGLSAISGVDKPTISRAENGRMIPYPGQVAKLVAALRWEGDPNELFEVMEQ